jgi:hypothetical protein
MPMIIMTTEDFILAVFKRALKGKTMSRVCEPDLSATNHDAPAVAD